MCVRVWMKLRPSVRRTKEWNGATRTYRKAKRLRRRRRLHSSRAREGEEKDRPTELCCRLWVEEDEEEREREAKNDDDDGEERLERLQTYNDDDDGCIWKFCYCRIHSSTPLQPPPQTRNVCRLE